MMSPKSRANFRNVAVLLLVFSAVMLAMRNFDQAIPKGDTEAAMRNHAVQNPSGQSILEASLAQQKPLDWKQLCEIAEEESGRNWQGWNARKARYARGLEKFTIDELLDLLAKIPNLSCSDTATAAISSLVLDAMIKKEHSVGFSLALSQDKGNYALGAMVAAKFREWVEMDPQAAELWLIQQDWGNSAETPQPPLIDMGWALLSRHLNQDIDQAGLFIHHLPMASRYEIIKYGFTNCEGGLR